MKISLSWDFEPKTTTVAPPVRGVMALLRTRKKFLLTLTSQLRIFRAFVEVATTQKVGV